MDYFEEIFFVFDGLDEFKDYDSCMMNEVVWFGNSLSEEMLLLVLYVKFL